LTSKLFLQLQFDGGAKRCPGSSMLLRISSLDIAEVRMWQANNVPTCMRNSALAKIIHDFKELGTLESLINCRPSIS
jgi:hypothetical protein